MLWNVFFFFLLFLIFSSKKLVAELFFFLLFLRKSQKKNYQRAKLVELHNTKVKIITSVELQNIFAFCKQCAAGTGKPIIFKSINIVERRSPTVIFSSIAKGAIEIKTSHRAIINCIKNNTIFRNIYNVWYINKVEYTNTIISKYFKLAKVRLILVDSWFSNKWSYRTILSSVPLAFF